MATTLGQAGQERERVREKSKPIIPIYVFHFSTAQILWCHCSISLPECPGRFTVVQAGANPVEGRKKRAPELNRSECAPGPVAIGTTTRALHQKSIEYAMGSDFISMCFAVIFRFVHFQSAEGRAPSSSRPLLAANGSVYFTIWKCYLLPGFFWFWNYNKGRLQQWEAKTSSVITVHAAW